MTNTPETLGKAEFAKFIGRSPSYVTALRKAGRLAMTEGGRVRVAESLRLMLETKGIRDDVAARWAALAGMEIPTAPREAQDAPVGALGDGGDVVLRRSRAESEARRAAALADQEEMNRDKMAGNLIAREDVDAAMRFLGAAVRSALDVFPDQVAPLVAPVTSLDEAHALLVDACRNSLDGIGQALARQKDELAKGAKA